jgi:hypothetical protein
MVCSKRKHSKISNSHNLFIELNNWKFGKLRKNRKDTEPENIA